MKQHGVYKTPKGYYYKVNKNSKSVRISKQEFQGFKNLRPEPSKLTANLNVKNSRNSVFVKATELNGSKIRTPISNYSKIKKSNKNYDEKFPRIKPFLKWVGGKNQIISSLIEKFPKKMTNYHEPFLGGGSVLIEVLTLTTRKKIEIKNKIYAYDQNKDLITVYRNIQTNHECLFEKLTLYFSQYHKLTTPCLKKEFYYKIRDKFNTMDKNTVDCSAIFIFLNKTCFRGLFRVSKNNKFNVPYGHYRNTPSGPSKTELDRLSNLIKNVIFMDSNFEKSFQQIIPQDFVYLDPPYYPIEKKKNSFNAYTAGGFDFKKHKKLFAMIKQLDKINVSFVLSNANNSFVSSTFNSFHVEKIQVKRRITPKKPDSLVFELVIHNINNQEKKNYDTKWLPGNENKICDDGINKKI